MLYNKQQKQKNNTLLTAAKLLQAKNIHFNLPANLIMLPGSNQGAYLKSISVKHYNLFADIELLSPNTAAIYNFSPGSAMCVLLAEFTAALGAKNFILLGSAGALTAEAPFAQRVLCTGAFCDEGTSKHYTNMDFIEPDKALTHKISSLCPASGHTWTTDALFRETEQEVEHYSALGAKTVEMEAAGLFSFCKYSGLNAAAAFIISDYLYGGQWQAEPKQGNTHKALTGLLKDTIDILG